MHRATAEKWWGACSLAKALWAHSLTREREKKAFRLGRESGQQQRNHCVKVPAGAVCAGGWWWLSSCTSGPGCTAVLGPLFSSPLPRLPAPLLLLLGVLPLPAAFISGALLGWRVLPGKPKLQMASRRAGLTPACCGTGRSGRGAQSMHLNFFSLLFIITIFLNNFGRLYALCGGPRGVEGRKQLRCDCFHWVASPIDSSLTLY